MELKELVSIIESEFAIPQGADYHTILPELEKNLGSIDTDIRENSLEILWAWATKGILTDNELIELGKRMAANLSFGLGESETDSVFLRSFSALILRGVIYTDRLIIEGELKDRNPILEIKLLERWFEQSLEYFISEQDLRGYIPIKIWAHSIAHCSDLLREFSLHPKFGEKQQTKILDVIAKKLIQPANHVFTAAEDARICRVVAAIQIRNLVSRETYEKWLQQIITPFAEKKWYDGFKESNNFIGNLNARVNVRLFLQRLYFMLQYNVQEFAESNELIFKNISEYRNALLEIITQGLKKMTDSNLFQ